MQIIILSGERTLSRANCFTGSCQNVEEAIRTLQLIMLTTRYYPMQPRLTKNDRRIETAGNCNLVLWARTKDGTGKTGKGFDRRQDRPGIYESKVILLLGSYHHAA